ncbi:MAG: DUF169 domain-containing protein [Armatimonadetes bacterium]|nr:DUF169 domain-containing protein [Armatimonadota bacterium]
MLWRDMAARLVDVLELSRQPVAISYVEAPVEAARTDPFRACTALCRAASGEVIDMTAQTSACPGGSYYLGFSKLSPLGNPATRDFLINGEKLFSGPAALLRALKLRDAQPPTGLAEHVIFAPLAQAPVEPDVVVFICNCSQAARLVALAYYFDGMPMRCDPTGSMCMSAITYPLVTGRFNITLGDTTARRMEKLGPDEMLVSVPWSMMHRLVAAIDRSSAGTARIEFPESMRRAGGT